LETKSNKENIYICRIKTIKRTFSRRIQGKKKKIPTNSTVAHDKALPYAKPLITKGSNARE